MENSGGPAQPAQGMASNSADHQACDRGDRKEGELGSATESRPPNLSSLQVPGMSLENALPSSSLTRAGSAGLPPRPNSTRTKSSNIKNLHPQRSFKSKNSSIPEGDRTILLIPGTPTSEEQQDKPSTLSRQFSLSKVFSSVSSLSSKRTHSLPSTPITNRGANSSANSSHVVNMPDLEKQQGQTHIKRSFSVPGNVKGRRLQRTGSLGLFRVISTPRHIFPDSATQNESIETVDASEGEGEHIPEEEAVCRICLDELGEGGETLKMECSCKGELALAHQECAIKWFSMKGNKTCDVCGQEVKNLSVTLLRIQNPPIGNRRLTSALQQQGETARYRVWQDVPVLVMVSMLAYFCFLEQLLVTDMGSRALAISLPFSCVLGLLSSMIASTMVCKSYIWAYASFQFAIVILFAHIFYNVLRVAPVLSVLLSSFTGFGIAISTNSLLVEYLRWRSTRNSSLAQQNNHGGLQHEAINDPETQDRDAAGLVEGRSQNTTAASSQNEFI